MEILSRSPENRRYLRSTVFYQLLHSWLRKLIRSFPVDDADDMLSFGTQTAGSNAVYIRVLKVVLVIIDHWLCLPYPIDPGFPFSNLICLSNCDLLEECKIDVSVELSILLAKAQRIHQEEWSPVVRHLLRLVIGSMRFCSNLRRRVQLDRMLREIKLNDITGSQLVRIYEEPSVATSLLENQLYDAFLIVVGQLKKEQMSAFLLKLMHSLPSVHNDQHIHVYLTVMMNYASALTSEQIGAFLLPFFSSLSSLSSTYVS